MDKGEIVNKLVQLKTMCDEIQHIANCLECNQEYFHNCERKIENKPRQPRERGFTKPSISIIRVLIELILCVLFIVMLISARKGNKGFIEVSDIMAIQHYMLACFYFVYYTISLFFSVIVKVIRCFRENASIAKENKREIEEYKKDIEKYNREKIYLEQEMNTLRESNVRLILEAKEKADMLLKENNGFISEFYYPHLSDIITVFERGRADTLKEAINLCENEHCY